MQAGPWQSVLTEKRALLTRVQGEIVQVKASQKAVEVAVEQKKLIRPSNEKPLFDPVELQSLERELRQIVGDLRTAKARIDHPKEGTAVGPSTAVGPRGAHTIQEATALLTEAQEEFTVTQTELGASELAISQLDKAIAQRTKDREETQKTITYSRMHEVPPETLSAYEQLELQNIAREHTKAMQERTDLETKRAGMHHDSHAAVRVLENKRLLDRVQIHLRELDRSKRAIESKGLHALETTLRRLDEEQAIDVEQRKKLHDLMKDQQAKLSRITDRIAGLEREAGPVAKLAAAAKSQALEEQMKSEEDSKHKAMSQAKDAVIQLSMREGAIRARLRMVRSLRDQALTQPHPHGETGPGRGPTSPDFVSKLHLLDNTRLTLEREIRDILLAHASH